MQIGGGGGGRGEGSPLISDREGWGVVAYRCSDREVYGAPGCQR